MELRGFDSYDVSLGDEMRGERASLGKSLEDAERDMRIKSRIIDAIENCDLAGFPNQSVIAGYVRSYARYLGMDAEICFKRFCIESGYRSPAALRAMAAAPGGPSAEPASSARIDPISRSRFAVPAGSTGFRPRVSLGALTSALALVGLIGGLSYGGYALLQDLQRVGFAPLPEAPAVVADAPMMQAPDVDVAPVARPDATDYAGGGVLTAIVMPSELPVWAPSRRDGPISAIDPSRAGVFDVQARPAGIARPSERHADSGDHAIHLFPARSPDRVVAASQVPQGVTLIAAEEAWIRVRDGSGAVLYEGVLGIGDRYDLPTRLAEPMLRAGNAGGIFILVDGVTYGPVGGRGRVVGGISLRASDVRASMPQANSAELAPVRDVGPEQRADAAAVSPNR